MKQRLKLGLAFYTDTPLLLLDEPTSNLDAQNIAWYKDEISKQLGKRLLIVASNQPEEYEFCKHIIRLQ
jgi:ABC-type multidrug transport system ATPase subunit